jgi:general secretion pathway protein M
LDRAHEPDRDVTKTPDDAAAGGGTIPWRDDPAAVRDRQLEGRSPTAAGGQVFGIAGRSGSPFLEGATVTVAGAALLQHVTAAVTRFGGNVLSSQVDLQGTRSKSGFLTVIVSCDIDQPSLQQLIYDVESGMPFLFVDQLVVQIPASLAESRDGKLRILLAVSGQWQGVKRAQDDKDTR